MPTEVVMPQMGESLSEGTLTKWLKGPGEWVERDEPLFEITTDKVDTEVPAPSSGRVERILVEEGETVSVGTVVAVLGEGAGEPVEAPPPSRETREAAVPAAGGGHFRDAQKTMFFRRRSAPSPPASPEPPKRPRLSPAVLALAGEHDLPLEELRRIDGSGRDGRLTRKDVERYVENREREEGAMSPARGREVAIPGVLEPPARYLYQPGPGDELIPMSETRKQIAEHMLWSQRISAPVTSFGECDLHRIARFREEAGARFERREGFPLTFLPFAAVAAITALREFPIFNASVVGDQIALKKHVDLGVAMSLAKGVIAPVVKRADEASFIGLARAIHELAERAQGEALEIAEAIGASFTITSPGMFGGMMGTPMIPQPQVAILALGAVQKKPVVVDDAIAIRPVMALALTFDHRIIDGAAAFRFLERIRGFLESFDLPDL